MLKTQNLSVAYGKQTIIPNLSVSIPKGKITALIAVSYTHLTLPTIYSV